MSPTFSRRQVLAAATTMATMGTMVTRLTPAHAAIVLPPNFSFTDRVSGTKVYLVPPEGGEPVFVTTTAGVNDWSPDGSRLAKTSASNVESVRADGSHLVMVNGPDDGWDRPVYSAGGRWVIFLHLGTPRWAWSDGSGVIGDLFPDFPGFVSSAHLSRSNLLLFASYNGNYQSLYTSALLADGTWSTPTLLISHACEPRFSPDDTKIAYVSVNDRNISSGLWIANADGTSPVNIAPDAVPGFMFLRWSPDSQYIYYYQILKLPEAIERVPVTGGTAEIVVSNAIYPGFRPMTTPSTVTRVWGELALDTAIAVSQSRWATASDPSDTRDRAQAVVISRGDAFYDALAGSALAATRNAPLLITPPTGLYAHAEAELKRVLPPGGLVYVLGGTAAVPQPIQERLKALGYQTKRLSGSMMYETAIAIADEITTATPDTVFIATGVEYYDALAAGAAAGSGQWGKAVVILTDGNRMPASSAAYLDSLDPTQVDIVLAGGPGAYALLEDAWRGGKLPHWPDVIDVFHLVGATAVETALMIAATTFRSPSNVAIATTAGWYDALTGGAMIGSRGGPLLLTPPSGLNPNLSEYLNDTSASLQTAYILGGTAALPQNLVAPVADQIGVPGHYDYTQIVPDYQQSANLRMRAATAAPAPDVAPPVDRSQSPLRKAVSR